MIDVRERFRALDELEVPDVMARARLIGPKPPSPEPARPYRRLRAVLVAAAIVIAAFAFAAKVFRNASPAPGREPTPSPTSMTIDTTPDRSPSVVVDTRSGKVSALPDSVRSLHAFDISVSPRGDRLAFVSGTDQQVYIANIDSTDVRRVTDGAAAWDPNWSPDGTLIAYASSGQIFVADVAGGSTTALTRNLGDLWEPAFAPDGRDIIFTRAKGTADWENLSLMRVSVKGGEVTTFMRFAAFGTFSPDGTHVAFMCIALPGDGHLWLNEGVVIASLDGAERLRFPDGVTDRDCNGPGGEISVGTWDRDAAWRPTWSPDGDQIAWVDTDHVVVVDVRTGDTRTIARGTHPTWIDERTLIVER